MKSRRTSFGILSGAFAIQITVRLFIFVLFPYIFTTYNILASISTLPLLSTTGLSITKPRLGTFVIPS